MKTAFNLQTKPSERRLWIIVLTFSAAVILGLGFLAWRVHTSTQPPLYPLRDLSPGQARVLGNETSGPTDLAFHRFDSAFSSEIDRLNHAFQSHPQMDAEEIVAKINAQAPRGQHPPCPLAWRDNELTLSLPTDTGSSLSPTGALTTCAAAIEKLR